MVLAMAFMVLPAVAQAATVLLGPGANPGATGSFNATATSTGYQDTSTPNTSNDFSAGFFYIAAAQNDQTEFLSVPSTLTPTATILHVLENTSAVTDTLTLTTTGCGGPYTITYSSLSINAGVPIAACSGATSASVSVPLVLTGASVTYSTIYTPSTAANTFRPFQANVFTETAKSTNNATTNTTNDIIFAGGYVALAKGDPQFSGTSRNGVACNTFNQTSPTSGGGPSGCTILYTISYKNLMPNPAQVSGETGDTCVDPTSQTTVPCTAQAGMAIADDGTIAASNWAQYTNGIAAAATDVPLGTGSFVYYNGAIGAPGNGTTYGTQCSSATPCKALKYVITNTIAPQQSGSFSFSATIH